MCRDSAQGASRIILMKRTHSVRSKMERTERCVCIDSINTATSPWFHLLLPDSAKNFPIALQNTHDVPRFHRGRLDKIANFISTFFDFERGDLTLVEWGGRCMVVLRHHLEVQACTEGMNDRYKRIIYLGNLTIV